VIICLDDDTPQLLRDPEDYNKIGEMPVYKPTREELEEPFLLLQNLKAKGFEKIGAVKVQAPPEWSAEFSFNPVGKRFNTRKQMLKNMIKGKVKKQLKFFSSSLDEAEGHGADRT